MEYKHELGFPREILELIFLSLDPHTFVKCRRVCKGWYEILDYLSERKYWKDICEKNPDIYKPIHEKGLLNWKTVFKNACLWRKINKAVVTVGNVITDEGVEHIYVNNDEELCITLRNKLLMKDASTLENIKSVEGSYAMFVKNSHMAAILTNHKSLHLQTINGASSFVTTLDNVQLFRILGNKCIYFTTDKRLRECNLECDGFHLSNSLATWYNSDNIVALHLYNDNIYVLSESGKYFVYKNNRLICLNKFTWDDCQYICHQRFYLFGENNLIYSNDLMLFIELKTGDKRDYKDIREITAILLHGNVLILGTNWGKVYIYVINSFKNLLCLPLDSPLFSYSLEGSPPIYGFEILEECCAHTLFVRTRNKVTSINFNHKLK